MVRLTSRTTFGASAPVLPQALVILEIFVTCSSVAFVRTCYQFFLGRVPEEGAPLNDRAALAPHELIAVFLSSDEFQNQVVSSLVNDSRTEGLPFRRLPDSSLILSLTDLAPLTNAGRERVLAAKTWFSAFHELISDDVFSKEVLQDHQIELSRILTSKLAKFAVRPVVEVNSIEVGSDCLTVTLSRDEFAPIDYFPVLVGEALESSDADIVVEDCSFADHLVFRVECRSSNHSEKIRLLLDGDVICPGVELRCATSEVAQNLIGQLDVCGPIFLSGWVAPISGSQTAEYEVRIDNDLAGKGRIEARDGVVPRFLFAIPKRYKDGRRHDVVIRRIPDGQILPARENGF